MVVTNMIQIVIASMFFMDFVPYYDQITGHCQGPYKDGGYPYSETTAVALSTAAFYIMVPLTIHTILNTFVWGLAPDWLEGKKKSKGITPVIEGAKKTSSSKRSAAAGRMSTVMRHVASVPDKYVADTRESENEFTAYGQTFNGLDLEKISPLRLLGMIPDRTQTTCCPCHGRKLERITVPAESPFAYECERCHTPMPGGCAAYTCEEGLYDVCQNCYTKADFNPVYKMERDLFLHDPRFWQQPWVWTQYFKETHGDGNVVQATWMYFMTMGWKVTNLLKLTFGYWDDIVLESFQIKYRSEVMDINPYTEDEHEAILRTIGASHALFWQFVPRLGIFLAKAGEAFNETPLFIFDKAVVSAMKVAFERYEVFLGEKEKDDRAIAAEHEKWENACRLEAEKEDDGVVPETDDDVVSVDQTRDEFGMSVPKHRRTDTVTEEISTHVRLERPERLPRGWKAIRNFKGVGNDWMYLHAKTGVRTFDVPTQELTWNNFGKVVPVLPSPSENDMEVTRRDDHRDEDEYGFLPSGWTAGWSRSVAGTRAYTHEQTGTRTIERPTEQNEQQLIEHFKAAYRKMRVKREAERAQLLAAATNEEKDGEQGSGGLKVQSVHIWLEGIKAGYSERYAARFISCGVTSMDKIPTLNGSQRKALFDMIGALHPVTQRRIKIAMKSVIDESRTQGSSPKQIEKRKGLEVPVRTSSIETSVSSMSADVPKVQRSTSKVSSKQQTEGAARAHRRQARNDAFDSDEEESTAISSLSEESSISSASTMTSASTKQSKASRRKKSGKASRKKKPVSRDTKDWFTAGEAVKEEILDADAQGRAMKQPSRGSKVERNARESKVVGLDTIVEETRPKPSEKRDQGEQDTIFLDLLEKYEPKGRTTMVQTGDPESEAIDDGAPSEGPWNLGDDSKSDWNEEAPPLTEANILKDSPTSQDSPETREVAQEPANLSKEAPSIERRDSRRKAKDEVKLTREDFTEKALFIDVSQWLNSIRRGYGKRYASIFEDMGIKFLDHVQEMSRSQLEAVGLKLSQISEKSARRKLRAALRVQLELAPQPPQEETTMTLSPFDLGLQELSDAMSQITDLPPIDPDLLSAVDGTIMTLHHIPELSGAVFTSADSVVADSVVTGTVAPDLPVHVQTVRAWLDSIRRGYGKRYASIFERIGIKYLDQVQKMSRDQLETAGGALKEISDKSARRRLRAALRLQLEGAPTPTNSSSIEIAAPTVVRRSTVDGAMMTLHQIPELEGAEVEPAFVAATEFGVADLDSHVVTIAAWLDSIKSGYCKRYASIFEQIGITDLGRLRAMSGDQFETVSFALRKVGDKSARRRLRASIREQLSLSVNSLQAESDAALEENGSSFEVGGAPSEPINDGSDDDDYSDDFHSDDSDSHNDDGDSNVVDSSRGAKQHETAPVENNDSSSEGYSLEKDPEEDDSDDDTMHDDEDGDDNTLYDDERGQDGTVYDEGGDDNTMHDDGGDDGGRVKNDENPVVIHDDKEKAMPQKELRIDFEAPPRDSSLEELALLRKNIKPITNRNEEEHEAEGSEEEIERLAAKAKGGKKPTACPVCSTEYERKVGALTNEELQRTKFIIGTCGHTVCRGCWLKSSAMVVPSGGIDVLAEARCPICRGDVDLVAVDREASSTPQIKAPRQRLPSLKVATPKIDAKIEKDEGKIGEGDGEKKIAPRRQLTVQISTPGFAAAEESKNKGDDDGGQRTARYRRRQTNLLIATTKIDAMIGGLIQADEDSSSSDDGSDVGEGGGAVVEMHGPAFPGDIVLKAHSTQIEGAVVAGDSTTVLAIAGREGHVLEDEGSAALERKERAVARSIEVGQIGTRPLERHLGPRVGNVHVMGAGREQDDVAG